MRRSANPIFICFAVCIIAGYVGHGAEATCSSSEEMANVLQIMLQQQELLQKLSDDVEQLRNNSDKNCVVYPGSPSNSSGAPGILVQQYYGGGNPFFNRTWAEYKAGFGIPSGNYWIGLDTLHQLTKAGTHRIRFDLQSIVGQSWYWAEYSSFNVGNESSQYTLHITGYSGTAGDAFNRKGDSANLNGAMFSTLDRDNDMYRDRNCALRYGGGFWFTDMCATYTNYRSTQPVCLTCSNMGGRFNWFPTFMSPMTEIRLLVSRMTVF
jgi:hypothetical protein